MWSIFVYLFISVFFNSSVLFAGIEYITLPSVHFENPFRYDDHLNGVVVQLPEGVSEIDFAVSRSTTIKMYSLKTAPEADHQVQKEALIASSEMSRDGDWAQITFASLDREQYFYFEFTDFLSALTTPIKELSYRLYYIQDGQYIPNFPISYDDFYLPVVPIYRIKTNDIRGIIKFTVSPSIPILNTEVKFDVEWYAEDGSSLTFDYDFDGDGKFDVLGAGDSVVYRYSIPGEYSAKVCIHNTGRCRRTLLAVSAQSLPVETRAIHSEHISIYWPEGEYEEKDVKRLIDIYEKVYNSGYFDSWGYNKEWLNPILTVFLLPAKEEYLEAYCKANGVFGGKCENILQSGTSMFSRYDISMSLLAIDDLTQIFHKWPHTFSYRAYEDEGALLRSIPYWFHEGIPGGFQNNDGFAVYWNLEYNIAIPSSEFFKPVENVIKKMNTDEYMTDQVQFTRAAGGLLKLNFTDDQIYKYWKSYVEEDPLMFEEVFGITEKDFYNSVITFLKSLEVSSEEVYNPYLEIEPDNHPQMTFLGCDDEKCYAYFDGEGEYYIQTYINGSYLTDHRIRAQLPTTVSVEHRAQEVESIRFYARRVITSNSVMPYPARDGYNYVIALKDDVDTYIATSWPVTNDMKGLGWSRSNSEYIEFQPKPPQVVDFRIDGSRMCVDFVLSYFNVEEYNGSPNEIGNNYVCYDLYDLQPEEKIGFITKVDLSAFPATYGAVGEIKFQNILEVPEIYTRDKTIDANAYARMNGDKLSFYAYYDSANDSDQFEIYISVILDDNAVVWLTLTDTALTWTTVKTPVYRGPLYGHAEPSEFYSISASILPEGEYKIATSVRNLNNNSIVSHVNKIFINKYGTK